MRHGRPLDQVVVGLVPRRLRLEHSRRSLPGDLDDADVLFGGTTSGIGTQKVDFV